MNARTHSAYGYVSDSPLNAVDPSGLETIGLCGTASFGWLGGLGMQEWCPVVSVSPTGHVEVGSTSSYTSAANDIFGDDSPGGFGWLSASLGISKMWSSCDSLSCLGGESIGFGGSCGVPGVKLVGPSIDGAFWASEGQLEGSVQKGVSAGAALGGGELHFQEIESSTDKWFDFDLPDPAGEPLQ